MCLYFNRELQQYGLSFKPNYKPELATMNDLHRLLWRVLPLVTLQNVGCVRAFGFEKSCLLKVKCSADLLVREKINTPLMSVQYI